MQKFGKKISAPGRGPPSVGAQACIDRRGAARTLRQCPDSRPGPGHPDADYTFAQIGVARPIVDYIGNCGNMSGAVGPCAIDEGLVPVPKGGKAHCAHPQH